MDELQLIYSCLDETSEDVAVYDVDDGYGEDTATKVTEAIVTVSDNTDSAQLTVAGRDEDVAAIGYREPTTTNGEYDHVIVVGDELRVLPDEARRYTVVSKHGIPSDSDPELWQLGLERANDDTFERTV